MRTGQALEGPACSMLWHSRVRDSDEDHFPRLRVIVDRPRVVVFLAPVRALVERDVDFRVVLVREIFRLVDEDRDLVDFDAVDRDVVFFVAAVRFTFFLVAPLLALVDLEAVDRDVILFLAAPVFAFVDVFVVLAVPLRDLVDLEAPLFALIVRPLAVVDRAVPLRDFVDLVVLDLLRDVDVLPLDVDFVAISVGSSANSGGYPSAISCFTPAPEQTKQPAVDSVLTFVLVVL